jgi:hypothetical protein
MTIRNVSRGEAVAFMLLLCLAGRGRAQEAPFRDPNFPNASGDVTLSPGNANATRLGYIFRNGPHEEPDIDVAFGTSFHTMKYYGYGEEGSWLGDDQGNLYTLKANVLTRQPAKAQIPKNLRNGSELYRTRVLGRAETDGHTAEPAGNSAPEGNAGFRDPNFPNASGDVTLAPRNTNATRLGYIFRFGPNEEPEIRVAFGTSFHTMVYYGYRDEGSWLADDQGNLYTLKGNVLTRQPAKTQIPRNLRNGTEFYRTQVLGMAYTEKGPIAAPAPPVGGATPERPRPFTAPPGSTGGTDAKIERNGRGATLSYQDGSGEHRYAVRRPLTATAGTDAIDTGGWIYVAADGKSGMLFNVSANRSVTVMPLAQPMLGMLAGRGN